jgi:hypothetical protein
MSADEFFGGEHMIRVASYAENPALTAEVDRREGLVGVEPVYALLDRLVGKTLANSVVSPCAHPVASIQAPVKSGARSAVHTWAATSPTRVNVVTWCFSDDKTEVSHTFFSRLMTFAATRRPAILLLHRISQRAPSPLVQAIYDSVWRSYYAFYDQRTTSADAYRSAPPFWVVMLDQYSAAQILPGTWACSLTNTVVIAGFSPSQKAAYLGAMIEQELVRRLVRREDVRAVMESYAPAIAEVLAAEEFADPRDIAEYVRTLFSVPVERLTVETLVNLSVGDGVTPRDTVLPVPTEDFHTAVALLRRRREREAQQYDTAVQAAAAQQRAEQNARLTALMPNGTRQQQQ